MQSYLEVKCRLQSNPRRSLTYKNERKCEVKKWKTTNTTRNTVIGFNYMNFVDW